MIVVRLSDGLGNQMFQYALALKLRNMYKTKVVFDMEYFQNNPLRKYELGVFGIKVEPVSELIPYRYPMTLWKRVLLRIYPVDILTGIQYVLERDKSYNDFVPMKNLDVNRIVVIQGFWQSEKYFCDISAEICRAFSFKKAPNVENENMIQQIKKTNNSVGIHVRRGDYLTDMGARDSFGTCSLEYYKRGMAYLEKKYGEMNYFMFSDDIDWVRKSFHEYTNVTYVSHNKCKHAYEDMRLMSLCQHNIIANSTFSWWGAWLNNNPGKTVVAPRRWFQNDKIAPKDIIPSSWIKL